MKPLRPRVSGSVLCAAAALSTLAFASSARAWEITDRCYGKPVQWDLPRQAGFVPVVNRCSIPYLSDLDIDVDTALHQAQHIVGNVVRDAKDGSANGCRIYHSDEQ